MKIRPRVCPVAEIVIMVGASMSPIAVSQFSSNGRSSVGASVSFVALQAGVA
jgi:hypothetical protein